MPNPVVGHHEVYEDMVEVLLVVEIFLKYLKQKYGLIGEKKSYPVGAETRFGLRLG